MGDAATTVTVQLDYEDVVGRMVSMVGELVVLVAFDLRDEVLEPRAMSGELVGVEWCMADHPASEDGHAFELRLAGGRGLVLWRAGVTEATLTSSDAGELVQLTCGEVRVMAALAVPHGPGGLWESA